MRVLLVVLVLAALLGLVWTSGSFGSELAVRSTADEGAEAPAPPAVLAAPEEPRSAARAEVSSEDCEEAPDRQLCSFAADLYRPRPEDPVERGGCVLSLALVDFETEEPVSGETRLWRLGAPGNESWSPGDQVQRSVFVPREGIELEELPAGEYRLEFLDAARHAPYSEPFAVGGAWTRHVVRVHALRDVPVTLELFDRDGTRIEVASFRDRGRSRHNRVSELPPWRVERTALEPYSDWGTGGMGGSYSYRSHASWKERTAGPDGFELGALEPGSRRRSCTHAFGVRLPDGREARIELEDLDADATRLVGVFVDEDAVRETVVSYDPQEPARLVPIARFGSSTRIRCLPIPRDGGRDWTDAGVEVVVMKPNAEHLRRVWRPRDGALATLDMELTED